MPELHILEMWKIQRTPDFEKLFSVNVKGVFHMLKSCIPHMKAQGGVILNMSSIAALVGLSDRFAYSMSKGAVSAMTISVAKDYISYRIRCNSISPARVHTPFVDGFIAKNYPGWRKRCLRNYRCSQPIGQNGKTGRSRIAGVISLFG